MSGHWEVVGRKKGKESITITKKPGPENKKSVHQSAPKVEEVLPLQQVKNLYNSGKNKENRKPQEKNKPQENGTKKAQKKPEKPQEPPKPKPPKSVESALNSITVEEFKSVFEERKRLFPDGPLIWLKEAVQFLNQRVPVEVQDQTFSSRPEGYPFSVVPSALRNVIEKSIKEAGKNNAQLFFDISLTAMANDMSKNLPVLGHKFYIQYLAMAEPNFVLMNLNKHLILRNSYQNRQPIGLSILWALGQAGIKDLHVGLKVFQEVMLPVIEMKSYSRYIVQYLIALINRHDKIHINTDQYLLILDVAFANYKNFPSDLRQDMQKVAPKLETMLLAQNTNDKYHGLVEPLLKKMLSNNNTAYQNDLCKVLVECMSKDQSAFNSWSKCYTKCLPQSAILLNYIDEKWNSKSFSNKFNKTVFVNLLNTYSVTNEELLTKKRKEPGLLEAVTAIKRLNDKMAAKKGSGFPYKFASFILIAFISGVIYYDIVNHGSWERSRTYTGLKQAGILEFSHKAVDRTTQGLHWAHQHIDEQFPGYYEQISEFVRPYAQVTRELGLIASNVFANLREAAVEKYPAVMASIESYAPGLLEQSQKAVHNAWSTSVLYFNRSVDYLKTEVFVGQLAPENMQRVVLEAFNTTQQKAADCYHWLYEKVQSTIK